MDPEIKGNILTPLLCRLCDNNCIGQAFPDKTSCWMMMCSRNCQNHFLPEDTVVILKSIREKPKALSFILSVLYYSKEEVFNTYLFYLLTLVYETSSFKKPIVNLILFKCMESVETSNRVFWLCTYLSDCLSKEVYTAIRTRMLKKISNEFHTALQSSYHCAQYLMKENIRPNHAEASWNDLVTKHYPINPKFTIDKIDASDIEIKKSLNSPILIPVTIRAPGEKEDTAFLIKKCSLGVEHIVMNCIVSIRHILEKNGVNAIIVHYNIIPVSKTFGLVEIVSKAETIQDIRQKHKFSIQNYIMENNPHKTIDDIRDEYMRSCVGYCIVGFILGIGDRHLDNIMCSQSGYLFHIDFDYVLGDDPKLIHPEIRITPEMIDAMGGCNSVYYKKFKDLCSKAFAVIRRYAELWYTLLLPLCHLSDEYTEDKIYTQIMKRCMVGEHEDTAQLHFITKVAKSSSSSYKHRFVDFAHESMTSRTIQTIKSWIW